MIQTWLVAVLPVMAGGLCIACFNIMKRAVFRPIPVLSAAGESQRLTLISPLE